MTMLETVSATHSWTLLEPIFSTWRQFRRTIRERRDAACEKSVRCTLPAHLRQDIGDLDCRPPHPAPLDQVLRDRQTSLEGVWLEQTGWLRTGSTGRS